MASHTSLLQFDTGPAHPAYQSPAAAISLGSLTNSDTRSLSSPQNAVVTDGPLKTLNTFQPDDPIESELHDPILCSVITEGEAYVIFRLQVLFSFSPTLLSSNDRHPSDSSQSVTQIRLS